MYKRQTLTRLYHEKASWLDFETLEILCKYLDVGVADLLEVTDEEQ